MKSESLIFDALSDHVRRRILACLGESGECSVSELCDAVPEVGRTTISSHLRVLRTSGVVAERRAGRHRFYSIDREGTVGAAVSYLHRILSESVPTSVDAASADSDDGTETRMSG